MRRCLSLLAGAGVALAFVPATEASAATSKIVPSITKVAPMRVKVGSTITIRGKHFERSAKKNTVLFKGTAGRSVLAKPSKASSTKLVVKVPKGAERILTQKSGGGIPTRIRLRVVTKRYGAISNVRQSPVIVSARTADDPLDGPVTKRPTTPGRTSSPATSGGIPAPCGTGDDWDGDLLSNATELSYALNPCSADSDGDGMGDGWEYWAAKDLNVRAVPYPGKKPYPNPLDGSDAVYDFDGDSLTSSEEYRAWVITGRRFEPANPYSPLGYSDGTQASRPTEPPAVPAFRAAQYGLNQTPPPYPAVQDNDGDGVWTDDDRDADADGLNNFVETHGPGHASWWTSVLAAQKPTAPEPWPGTDPTDPANYQKNYYGSFTIRPFQDTALDDPDMDGDTLLDGEDDQDADDVPNYNEMYAPVSPWTNGNRKNAFNPCAPVTNSRTCPRYFPIR